MKVMGIDPGKKGGLCLMTDNKATHLELMPDDYQSLAVIIKQWAPDYIYIEKQWARPGNAAKSTFVTAQGYGEILGTVKCLRYPFVLVAPAKWCALIHKGANRGTKATKTTAKQRSKEMALSLFPYMSFLATPRSRKFHDGLGDAILIAEYGRRDQLGLTNAASK